MASSIIKTSKKVVIVGGGIAGSLLAKSLQNHVDVYLIDPKEYFEITWASSRCMVEPSFAERSVINHSEYAPNAHIITSPASSITHNEVKTAHGQVIPYNYLVIATGHNDEKAPFTKTEKLSLYKSDQEEIKSANSVLIIGGGPSGVELAGEIAVDFPEKKITLVHRGPRILEFVNEKASVKALKWLLKKHVDVIVGESVDLNSQSNGVYKTSGGKSVHADCHFLCIGKPLASSWLKGTILEECLDVKGRLMVDAELRVKGKDNIFAIGDITDINEMKQGYLAQMHSRVVAKNIKSLASGNDKMEAYRGGPEINDIRTLMSEKDKLKAYKGGREMAIVTLGRREALAQISSTTMSGRIPGIMKSRDLFVSKTRKTLGLKSS